MANKNLQRPEALRDGVYDASDCTPDNSNDLPDGECRGIWVGVAGNVEVVFVGGSTVIMPAVAAGMWHPMRARRIRAAGTTATGIKVGY